jgi:type IV pilus assembly protein PilA
MIVVAIVGILAALAIYGVTKYVRNAKTAEARDALGRMSKDAAGAYNRENMAPEVLGLGEAATAGFRLCGSATAVPSGDPPKGSKYQSSPAEWNGGTATAGWKCLRFSMNDPQYFQYNYTQDGDASVDGSFSTIAKGDLDGDGSSYSTFAISGSLQKAAGKTIVTLSPSIQEINPDE